MREFCSALPCGSPPGARTRESSRQPSCSIVYRILKSGNSPVKVPRLFYFYFSCHTLGLGDAGQNATGKGSHWCRWARSAAPGG